MSLLKKLEELGYKPKKVEEKEETSAETEDILKNIKNSETKQQILNLLLEALSEIDPREILVYGMYVKKYFSPIIGGKQKDNIEKTLELLVEALNKE
jgi:hypothetical protein